LKSPDDSLNTSQIQPETGYAYRVTRRLILLITLVMVFSSMAVAVLTFNDFNRLLTPELGNKARTIGHIVENDIKNALNYGIPFESVYGADSYLQEIVDNHHELTYVAIAGADGTLRYQSGAITDRAQDFLQKNPALTARGETTVIEPESAVDHIVPIVFRDEVLGSIHVGIDRKFVQRQLDDILFDILVILIAAVLVTLEVMLALLLVYGMAPIHRLNVLLDQQSKGDFSHIVRIRTRDAIGRAAHRLSHEARKLHSTYFDLCTRFGMSLEALGVRTSPESNSAHLRIVGERFGLLSRTGPTQLRQAEASDVRIPLFVFAFAEELQKSFLPLFVREIHTPVPWLSEPVVVGLPIVIYLGVLALASLFAGGWTERHGSRRLFLVGLIPSVAGFLGCAVAGSIEELMVWRGITALGYAAVTISCQDYVIANSTTTRLGKNLVIFVGIIMSATMCGTAIGGILADRVGYRAVFAVAALLALVAGAIAAGMLTDDKGKLPGDTAASETQRAGMLRNAATVLSNFRFILFLLCVAIPANVVIAAYLWYLAPLYLSDLGASTSEIARVIMVYYLLIVLLNPIASKVSGQPGGLVWLVGLGSLFSAGGLILFYDWQSIWGFVLTVSILGVTHALTKGAQIALALQICSREIPVVGRTTVLSVLRFLERTGSMLGLLLAAVLIEAYGYEGSIGITGALVFGSAFLFLIVQVVDRRAV